MGQPSDAMQRQCRVDGAGVTNGRTAPQLVALAVLADAEEVLVLVRGEVHVMVREARAGGGPLAGGGFLLCKINTSKHARKSIKAQHKISTSCANYNVQT